MAEADLFCTNSWSEIVSPCLLDTKLPSMAAPLYQCGDGRCGCWPCFVWMVWMMRHHHHGCHLAIRIAKRRWWRWRRRRREKMAPCGDVSGNFKYIIHCVILPKRANRYLSTLYQLNGTVKWSKIKLFHCQIEMTARGAGITVYVSRRHPGGELALALGAHTVSENRTFFSWTTVFKINTWINIIGG